MYKKLLLAVTITLALKLFLGVRLSANTQTANSSYVVKISKIFLYKAINTVKATNIETMLKL